MNVLKVVLALVFTVWMKGGNHFPNNCDNSMCKYDNNNRNL